MTQLIYDPIETEIYIACQKYKFEKAKIKHTALNELPHGKTNNLHRRKTKTQISFAVTKLIYNIPFYQPRPVYQ